MERSHTMWQHRSVATAHCVLHCAVRFPPSEVANTSSRIQPYSTNGQTWSIHPPRPCNMPPASRRICFALCFCERFLAYLQDKTYIIDVGPGIPSPILAVVPGAGVFFFIAIVPEFLLYIILLKILLLSYSLSQCTADSLRFNPC